MTDKISKTIQAAIDKLETRIAGLETDLTDAKNDLKHKQEILKLAQTNKEPSHD